MTFETWLMVAILATTFGLLIFTRLPPAAAGFRTFARTACSIWLE